MILIKFMTKKHKSTSKKIRYKVLSAIEKLQRFFVFPVTDEIYAHDDVVLSNQVSHANFMKHVVQLGNKEGFRVLEIGSREVTGPSKAKQLFDKAQYLGFDFYDGQNVDVVGDAHHLSSFFDEPFDLIYSTAVFEHLAMPWVVATEIAKTLKVGGIVAIETHFSFSSHERPWHFFHFSDMGLKALFSPALGFECIEAGLSSPIVGRFSHLAAPYLRKRKVTGLYCHSEFLGRKIKDVQGFSWDKVDLDDVVQKTRYPKPNTSYLP